LWARSCADAHFISNFLDTNDDFHESQQELSGCGCCLLMWKVVQACDLH
jgi:hypothetical protein